MRQRRGRGRLFRGGVRTRRIAVVVAVAVGLTVAVPTGAVPAGGAFPLAWVAELFAHAPAWSAPPDVPEQSGGTAAGKDHHVATGATSATGGAGRAPGRAPGALPAQQVYQPEVGRDTTPTIAGEHSFQPGQSRRIASAARESSDVYANPDGSYTRKVYDHPVNYRAADGSWRPIDETLVRDGGRLRRKASPVDVSLAAEADDPALADLRLPGGRRVAYSLLGADAAPAEVDGDTAIYRDVLPGVDVTLRALPNGTKESLVLRSPEVDNSWVFPLRLSGLTPSLEPDGSVALRDADGEVRARVPVGFMEDSRFDREYGDFTRSYAVRYELTEVDGAPALRVTADEAWLRDPARVYPVTVDPTTFFAVSGDTYVSSANPGAHGGDEELNVGTYNGGGDKNRAFLHFTGFGATYAGAKISSASLKLYLSWAYTCTAKPFTVREITEAWTVDGTRSYPGPSVSASIGTATPDPGVACTNTGGNRSIGEWVAVPLNLAVIQDWARGGTNHGLALLASESDSTQWKRFTSGNPPVAGLDPHLSITYTDNVAPQVNAQAPASGYAAPSLTPELMATAKDPDGWPSALSYNFQVYNSSGTKLFESGAVSSRVWRVPAGKLSWGQTYLWTVIASDGNLASSSQKIHAISTAVPQPPVTANLASNGGRGFDPSVGNYTTAATDAVVSTVGPALAVQRSYNSLDPRADMAFGTGWSSLLDASVTTEATDGSSTANLAVVRYPDGREVAFGKNANGSYTPPPGKFATLTAVTGGFKLVDKDGTGYTFTAATPTAGVSGLTSVTDAQGRALSLTYDATLKRPTKLTSAAGRALHLTWSAGAVPRVATVSTDPVTAGAPGSALTWTYHYDGSELVRVCPPTSSTACTSYTHGSGTRSPSTVLNTGPYSYWRLGEASGTVAASAVEANQGTDNAAYANVTLGRPGPLAGSTATAAGFNGTSSRVQLPAKLVAASSYQALSMWFRAEPGGAGPLFSYQKDPITNASTTANYTPALYVGTSGKLYGQFWYDGGVNPIVSPASVADGQWHHLTLSAAGNTQALHLDGVQLGTRTGVIQNFAEGATNYEYVGAGFTGNRWPDEPHNGGTTARPMFFAGDIAEVAFYDRPVGSEQVATVYAAGRSDARPLTSVLRPSGNPAVEIGYDRVDGTVRQVTDPAGGVWTVNPAQVSGSHQAYSGVVLSAGPAEYWRLAESGVAEAVNEVNGGVATYNDVTLGVPGGPFDDPARTDDDTTVAQFNGTSSYLALPAQDIPQAGPYTVSMWFKMNAGATSSGTLFGYQSVPVTSAVASPEQWTPALYVGRDGKLRGEIYMGNSQTPITSTAVVNDGKWHHVVLAAAANTQTMYLDGAQVGVLNAALRSTIAQYAYIGAGASTNWPSGSTGVGGFFPGQIAEAALFTSTLSATQVSMQYAARSSAAGVPVRTVKVTDPGGKALTYAYDVPMGRKVAEIDALGNKTQYGYDTGGFLRTVTDPNGDVTTTEHDVRGNTVSSTSCQDRSAGRCSTTYYTYYPDATSRTLTPDARNDVLLSVRDGRSASATDNTYRAAFGYDAAGNRTTVTDPLGRVTTTAYTDGTTVAAADGGFAPAGLPHRLTTAGGAVQEVVYFASGDVAKVTDPAGKVTTFSYDGLGRVLTQTETTTTFPAGLTTSFSYDGLGRLVSQTEPAVTNRVTGAVHTARTTTVYNDDGQVTSVTTADLTGGDASRTDSATYNARGQQVTQTDADGKITSFGYDAYGNLATETGPDGGTIATAYDATGKVLSTTLRDWTGDPNDPQPARDLVLESLAYDPGGRLASTTDAMGWQTAYRYTDNGLVATITRRDPATGDSFVTESNAYDAAGHLTSQTTNGGATTLAYAVDAAGRTTSSTLDPNGLARTTAYTYSPDDHVLSEISSNAGGTVARTDAGYDPLGRLTSQTVHTGHVTPGTISPSARWRLAETSGSVATDSVGGNNGTLTGGVTWSTEHGGSAQFDGTGVITTAEPAVDTSADFTVSAWVKLTDRAVKQKALSAAGVQQDAFDLQYDTGNGGVWKFNMKNADVAGATTVSARSTSAAAVGAWTHLAGVFDGATGEMRLYVDGVLEDTATNATAFNATGAFVVGRGMYNAAAGGHWTGGVSDVQVYGRELTGTEVAQVYAGTAPDDTPQLLRTTYAVDSGGLVTEVTDPNGNTTSYAYDEAGRAVVTTGPAVPVEVDGAAPVTGRSVSYVGYDTFGAPVETKDPNGNVTTSAFDAAGRMLSTRLPSYTAPGASEPITAEVTRDYDALGQLTSVTDPLGRITRYGYDQLGQVATVTAPNGGVSRFTYDLVGDQLSQTDATGATSTATYDYLGRRVTATDVVRQTGAAHTTRYAYGTGGWLSSVTSPAGVTGSVTYNAAGQTLTETDGAGQVTRYAYDGAGRLVRTTLPDGTYSATSYDWAGRASTEKAHGAAGTALAIRSWVYDGLGNITAATDARGTTTRFGYDAAGNLTSQTQPISASDTITTGFGYDLAGNRTRFTDGRGNSFLTTYNSWGLPESRIEPATAAHPDAADRTFTSVYDASGRLAQRRLPGGVVVANSYDSVGNLTGQSGTGAEAATAARSFGYDLAGRLTSASGPGGVNEFGYDDRGLLTSTAGPSGTATFGYNADGAMTSRTDVAGATSYTYDDAGRLAALSNPDTGLQATYTYNALSQPATVVYGGANTRRFGYDDLHRLTSDTLSTAGGAEIAKITYGYDANGNETAKTTTGFAGAAANTYTYDLANRLTSWTVGGDATVYAYDKSGNRVQAGSRLYTYDARNQLLTGPDGSYTYTARGTLRRVVGAGGTVETSADAFGQVVSQQAAGGGTEAYEYDALGRVVRAGFAYSGLGNTLAGDGAATYVRDPGDDVAGLASGGVARYAWTDLHTDLVGQFTAGGTTLAGSTAYDPLGAVLASSATLGSLGYQSEWTQPSTGRVNMWARWYNTGTGGFDTRDTAEVSPVGASVRANRFAYADANPLTMTDPTGHVSFGSLWNTVKSKAKAVVNTVKTAVTTAYNYASYYAGKVYDYAKSAYNYVADKVKTAVTYVKKKVNEGRQWVAKQVERVKQAASRAYEAVKKAGRAILAKTVKVVTKTVNKVKDAYKATEQWVKDHKDLLIEIAAIAGGIVAGLACTAVTAGAGAVACMVGAAALINLAKDGAQGNINNWGDAFQSLGTGALQGLAGGAGGLIAGRVAGAVATKLGSYAASVGGRMVVGGVAGGVEDAATQFLTTGRVDMGSVLLSATIGAVSGGRARPGGRPGIGSGAATPTATGRAPAPTGGRSTVVGQAPVLSGGLPSVGGGRGAPEYMDGPDNATPGGHAVTYTETGTAVGGDAITLRNLANIRNSGSHDVVAHGTRDGYVMLDGELTNGGQLVEAVRGNPNYVEGQPCRLVVCHAGASGVGQQVADELRVPVLAPLDRVGTNPRRGPGQEPVVDNDAGWVWLHPREG